MNFPHNSCTCRIYFSVIVFYYSIGAYWTDFPYIGAVCGVGPLDGFGGGGYWNSFCAFATYNSTSWFLMNFIEFIPLIWSFRFLDFPINCINLLYSLDSAVTQAFCVSVYFLFSRCLNSNILPYSPSHTWCAKCYGRGTAVYCCTVALDCCLSLRPLNLFTAFLSVVHLWFTNSLCIILL